MITLRGLLLTGALLAAVGGCATAGGSASGDRGIPVTVENNVAPPNSFTIWIETDAGMRQRLGSLTPNAVGRFRYSVPNVGQYRLVAEPRTGASVESSFFTITDAAGRIEWDMGARSVVVR